MMESKGTNMTLAGVVAILVGWLMIMPLQRRDNAAARSRRWPRYIVAFIGTWVLTAGMATVVNAGL
jgi:hypothetical protein